MKVEKMVIPVSDKITQEKLERLDILTARLLTVFSYFSIKSSKYGNSKLTKPC